MQTLQKNVSNLIQCIRLRSGVAPEQRSYQDSRCANHVWQAALSLLHCTLTTCFPGVRSEAKRSSTTSFSRYAMSAIAIRPSWKRKAFVDITHQAMPLITALSSTRKSLILFRNLKDGDYESSKQGHQFSAKLGFLGGV